LEGLDLGAIVSSIASQGPLVALLFYLHVQGDKKLAAKDVEIATLNKELRTTLETNLTKSHEAITNNTIALSAFKEVLKHA
jgi:hypothetical protein